MAGGRAHGRSMMRSCRAGPGEDIPLQTVEVAVRLAAQRCVAAPTLVLPGRSGLLAEEPV
jgi:hypothetical protein